MKQAKARKQEIMAPINAGKFILQAQIRFSSLVEKYMDARFPALGTSTREKYEAHIRNHILPTFGRAEIAEIDRQSIEAWLVREAGEHAHGERQFAGLGAWALTDCKNILSAIFSAAIDWGLWSGENPCARVRIGNKVPGRPKRIPDAAGLQAFLAAIPETRILSAEAARLIVLTAVVTGLRVSEILGLRPENVNTAAETVTVAQRWRRGEVGPVKTSASERVRQVGPLAAQLADLGRDKDWIFERGDTYEPADDRDLQQHVWRPAAEAAGIYHAGFGLHTFRRLNVTWRQEAGATPFEAMRAAGHTKPETTWLYTVPDAGRERKHVEAMFARAMPAEGEVQ